MLLSPEQIEKLDKLIAKTDPFVLAYFAAYMQSPKTKKDFTEFYNALNREDISYFCSEGSLHEEKPANAFTKVLLSIPDPKKYLDCIHDLYFYNAGDFDSLPAKYLAQLVFHLDAKDLVELGTSPRSSRDTLPFQLDSKDIARFINLLPKEQHLEWLLQEHKRLTHYGQKTIDQARLIHLMDFVDIEPFVKDLSLDEQLKIYMLYDNRGHALIDKMPADERISFIHKFILKTQKEMLLNTFGITRPFDRKPNTLIGIPVEKLPSALSLLTNDYLETALLTEIKSSDGIGRRKFAERIPMPILFDILANRPEDIQRSVLMATRDLCLLFPPRMETNDLIELVKKENGWSASKLLTAPSAYNTKTGPLTHQLVNGEEVKRSASDMAEILKHIKPQFLKGVLSAVKDDLTWDDLAVILPVFPKDKRLDTLMYYYNAFMETATPSSHKSVMKVINALPSEEDKEFAQKVIFQSRLVSMNVNATIIAAIKSRSKTK